MPDRSAEARVVFFGYGPLGAGAPALLAELGARLGAVVLPSNRGGPAVDDVRKEAERLGAPCLVQPPRRALGPFVEELRTLAPDLGVVWSYPMLLPPALLDVPRQGCVNIHSGLLPEYRGGHVVQWALANGEKESGVTLHWLDEGVDTGPVIAQTRFPIEPEDDALSLTEKIRHEGEVLLRRWWPDLVAGRAPRIPQDDDRARHWPLRTPEEGRIDWNESARRIHDLVRALVANRPGAFTVWRRQRWTLLRSAAIGTEAAAEPGTVVASGPAGVEVATGSGILLVHQAEVDGRVLSGAALAAEAPASGRRFGAADDSAEGCSR